MKNPNYQPPEDRIPPVLPDNGLNHTESEGIDLQVERLSLERVEAEANEVILQIKLPQNSISLAPYSSDFFLTFVIRSVLNKTYVVLSLKNYSKNQFS